jgi:hypothetical protein
MTTLDEVRRFADRLPRSYEALVRGRVKFRVGRIVYLAFSREETLMGFAFPKLLRQALIDSAPHKFLMPRLSDQRYNWVVVRLAEIDGVEMRDLVLDAWAMVVPKRVAAEYSSPDVGVGEPHQHGHGEEGDAADDDAAHQLDLVARPPDGRVVLVEQDGDEDDEDRQRRP